MPDPQASRPFLARALRTCWWFGGLGCLLALIYFGPMQGLRYALGFGWMMGNLYLWNWGVMEFFGARRVWVLGLFLILKFFLLTLLGVFAWFLGLEKIAPFLAFVLGLKMPFLVIMGKAVGAGLHFSPGKSNDLQEATVLTRQKRVSQKRG